jgi:hypothetical protein
VVIKTLFALVGEGEADEVRETLGGRVAKTESCFLSLVHLSFLLQLKEKHGVTAPIVVVTVGTRPESGSE